GEFFFFQAEDGIRDRNVLEFRRVLFRSHGAPGESRFRALAEAGLAWSAVDAVAVTQGPGLVGALLVGVVFAKALAYAGDRELIEIGRASCRGRVASSGGTRAVKGNGRES